MRYPHFYLISKKDILYITNGGCDIRRSLGEKIFLGAESVKNSYAINADLTSALCIKFSVTHENALCKLLGIGSHAYGIKRIAKHVTFTLSRMVGGSALGEIEISVDTEMTEDPRGVDVGLRR